jgi:hypothetical protein
MSFFFILFHIFQVVPQLNELAYTSITHVKHEIKMGIKTLENGEPCQIMKNLYFHKSS